MSGFKKTESMGVMEAYEKHLRSEEKNPHSVHIKTVSELAGKLEGSDEADERLDAFMANVNSSRRWKLKKN